MGLRRKGLVAPIGAAVLLLLAFVGFSLWVRQTKDLTLVTWLGSLPLAAIFAIVTVFWSLFALIAWWITERAFHPDGRDVTHENVARLLLVMSSFFVFVLGFVVSQEWSNATTARNDVSRGVAALYTAGYYTYPLPKESVEQIQASLDRLGTSIACQDLPSLRDTGKGDPRTGTALAETFKVVTRQPKSAQEIATFGNIVDELGAISQARRQWLSQAANGLPGVVLFSIFIVSGLLLATFVVQSTKSRRGHLVTIIGLVLLVSLGTGMVISLARPFAGAAQISAETFSQGPRSSNLDCSRPGSFAQSSPN